MDKINVYTIEGNVKASMNLPECFTTNVRVDLIRKVVRAYNMRKRVPYGPSILSGMRHSVKWAGKGKGVARTPRLKDSMRGAQAPNTVGGRAAHPPKPQKIYYKKINKKELKLAFKSALAAIATKDYILTRGHIISKELTYPIVVEDSIESVKSAKEASKILQSLGIWEDILKSKDSKKERAGKGKLRGRRLKRRKSALIVVNENKSAIGFKGIEGVSVKTVKQLSVSDLAPGGLPGRLTIFSKPAIDNLTEVRKL
jgi:large subunit ribosomal protein L4e